MPPEQPMPALLIAVAPSMAQFFVAPFAYVFVAPLCEASAVSIAEGDEGFHERRMQIRSLLQQIHIRQITQPIPHRNI